MTNLTELNLSYELRTMLERHGIVSVEDAANLTISQLLEMRGIGIRSVLDLQKEINDWYKRLLSSQVYTSQEIEFLDRCAIKAMPAILIGDRNEEWNWTKDAETLVMLSWAVAEHMLKERKKVYDGGYKRDSE